MAAALGSDLMTKVLGHSEAERIVRPWWEKLEDFCVYGLLLMGVILIPHAVILGTPIFCNYCQQDFCGDEHRNIDNATDPKFQSWWVARYCTYNGKNAQQKDAVHPFISFYPYIILGLAITLFSIDKIIQILFNAGEKLDKFYKLLEDNKILSGTEESQSSEADGSLQEIELRIAFRKNQHFFISFILRSALQIILASAFLFFIANRGFEITQEDDDIYCNVHGYWHECHGIPMKLYEYTIYFNGALISVYILTNIYNILWVLLPWFGKLSSVMRVYKKNKREAARKDNEKPDDSKILGDLYEIYYKNRDLKLFLELLAMGSGVAPAISFMTLYDSEFRESMKAKITDAQIKDHKAVIEITEPDSAVMKELDGTSNVDVMYVAEMDPPTADGAQVYDVDGDKKVVKGQLTEVKVGPTPTKSHNFTFENLDPNEEKYSVKIRTLVNGHTIVSSTKPVFKSTRASVPKGGSGGMKLFRKELKNNNSFEVILDNSTDHSSSEEESEKEEEKEGESLHDKVQAEHMKEIEKKKESEENYASSQQHS